VEPGDLIGCKDPTWTDGIRWQDGVFTQAIRTPGAVICLDEIGAANPSTGLAFNAALQDRMLTLETGEVVPFAPGVTIIGTSNDLLGLTDAGRQNYAGLSRQNAAFEDRFAVQLWMGYPDKKTEMAMLRDKVPGLSRTLARLLVDTANLSRTKLKTDEVTYGIGFRRLLAWAGLLTAGCPAEDAWVSTVLHFMPEGDHEVYRELARAQGVTDQSVIDAAIADRVAHVVDPNAPGSEFHDEDPDAA
jgi:hypothetical protein